MKTAFSLLFIILFGNVCFAQGLIFDSTEFNQQDELEVTRGIIPERYSLENRLPYLYPQIGGTCVAMSFSLARTMMIATELKLTDPKEISAYLFSPYYIYYLARNKSDFSCNGGLNPISVASVVKQYGFAPIAKVEYPTYYPFTNSRLCPNDKDFFPPVLSQKATTAKKFKVDEVYTIKNIDGIKYALSNNLPVILAMQIPKSFELLRGPMWKPLNSESKYDAGGHAIVAIGYDDNLYGGAIRIANSWGENWGDGGKAWIKYSDLKYWLDGSFVMQKTNLYGAPNELEETAFQNEKNPEIESKVFNVEMISTKINYSNEKLLKAFKKSNK